MVGALSQASKQNYILLHILLSSVLVTDCANPSNKKYLSFDKTFDLMPLSDVHIRLCICNLAGGTCYCANNISTGIKGWSSLAQKVELLTQRLSPFSQSHPCCNAKN